MQESLKQAIQAAGSAAAAIGHIRSQHPEGRVVVCSHGHIIPAYVSYLIAAHGLGDVPDLVRRGQWHRLRFDANRVSVALREAAPGFPS